MWETGWQMSSVGSGADNSDLISRLWHINDKLQRWYLFLSRIIRHMCSKHKHTHTHLHVCKFKGKGKRPQTEFTCLFGAIFENSINILMWTILSLASRPETRNQPLICHPSQQHFLELTDSAFPGTGKISPRLLNETCSTVVVTVLNQKMSPQPSDFVTPQLVYLKCDHPG